MIYLDTHVLVRLYQDEKLGPDARRLVEHDDLLASAAAVLELGILHEIGRLQPNAAKIIAALSEQVGLQVCELPFRTIVDYALKEGWTRDPFDRLIVANAKVRNAHLVTKDQRMHQHYPRAVW